MELTANIGDTDNPERQRISGDDFLALLRKASAAAPLKDYVVESNVYWDNRQPHTASDVIVENCHFKGGFNIVENELSGGIHFKDCSFDKTFRIQNTSFFGFHSDQSGTNANLVVSHCIVDELSLIDRVFISRGIVIEDNSRIRKLELKGVQITGVGSTGINIVDSEIEEQFDVSNVKVKGWMRIDGSTIGAQPRIHALRADMFVVQGKSVVKRDFQMSDCDFGSLSIGESEWMDDVILKGIRIKEKLTLYRGQFQKDVKVHALDENNSPPSEGSLSEVWIQSCDFGGAFSIYGNSTMFRFSKLNIISTSSLKGSLRFINVQINEVELGGLNDSASIMFENGRCNKLTFNRFQNQGHLAFANWAGYEQMNSQLVSVGSNLGATEFQNFPFTSFDTISITDSQWSNIVTSGVRWFTDEQLNTPEGNVPQFAHSKDPVDLSRRKREIYRQLKHACEKQGDRVQALVFKAREMKAFAIEVWSEGRTRESDYWVLLAGVTNDFGLNWIRPLCLTVFITLLFYPLLVVAASPVLEWWPTFTIDSIQTTVEQMKAYSHIFFQLFNPARVTERMLPPMPDDAPLHGSVYLLETLHRIILAFLIFQTISAFRKFVK